MSGSHRDAFVKQFRPIVTSFLLCTSVLCGGCVSMYDGFSALWNRSDEPESTASKRTSLVYGMEDDVLGTVDIIKTIGDVSHISSQAIRLPSNPLHVITAFDYEFPGSCGGHHFRVYEAQGMQILEYTYAPLEGRGYVIRDYVSGQSPFMKAGLWTAYDHTADSISSMNMQSAIRGKGLLAGTYSQGPMTGLDPSAKRVLGAAYDRALRDSKACRG